MTANELRIGNWVEIIQPKKAHYTTIEPSCFSVNIEKHYKPILLTEDWLIRFGFNSVSENKYIPNRRNFWNKEMDASIDVEHEKVGEYSFMYQLFGTERRKHIIYVHQLQNLHFFVKNQELILKKRRENI